jgi:hypothetical protein
VKQGVGLLHDCSGEKIPVVRDLDKIGIAGRNGAHF